MGSAYKKNMKNLQGKQDITGYDVLHLGASSIPTGAAGDTAAADAFGVTFHDVTRAARLEGLVANVRPALSSGELRVTLLVDGSSVGTATIDARSGQILLDKENGNEIILQPDQTLRVDYAVLSTLSAATDLSCRVHLALLED